MPPKGPDKHFFGQRVTLPTWEYLKEAAGDKSVPTYVAELLEKMAKRAEAKKRRDEK